MENLRTRSRLPEKMDDATVPEAEVRKALREIGLINRWLGGNKLMLHALEHIPWPDHSIKIMDIGSGGGDMLREIAGWALRNKKKVELVGIDINPAMTRYASSRSNGFQNLIFRTASVYDNALMEEGADIITCSLFTHHFDDADLHILLVRLTALARRHVIINDLHRHFLAYYGIKLLTRVFSRAALVRYDAPLSVARSLTLREWKEQLRRAGIRDYTIRWRWAWRWEIIIRKNNAHGTPQ